MALQDKWVLKLLDVLKLPKHTRYFELRCAVDEAVSVKCEYFPEEPSAADADELLCMVAEYRLEKIDEHPTIDDTPSIPYDPTRKG